MNNYFIIANSSKDIDYQLSNYIKEYLTNNDAQCIVGIEDNNNKDFRYTDATNIPSDTQCVITVGGDGTLLQAARDLIARDVVFLGINKGNLGFLAETGSDNIEPVLDRLLSDDFKTENRMMLSGYVERDGEVICESVALNDITIHRSGGIRVSDYDVTVNDIYLNKYHADGVIIATPTGSTAYNLSAGGPIVKPDASLILLTPICAHSINGKSIVLSSDDVIRIDVCEERNCKDDSSIVAFDGYGTVELIAGDKIVIKKSNLCTKLAKFDDCSFLQVLKNKMGDN